VVSPFVVGKMVTDSSKFHGRKRESQEITVRLRNMGSTSIVGPRRIGKSSLAYHIYRQTAAELGSRFDFVWLDGQSAYSLSMRYFFQAIADASSLTYCPAQDPQGCLINFEDAVRSHARKIILIINEFEILTDASLHNEFGKPFYNTLRLLAEQGNCALITTSAVPLRELCKHVLGVSSPFYNIFEQIVLGDFAREEVDQFLKHDHGGVILTQPEIQFIRKSVTDHQHPLILQIAADAVFLNRGFDQAPELVAERIRTRVRNFLTHEDVQEGRKVSEERLRIESSDSRISKPKDMLISILVPVLGIGLVMLEYGLLIQWLTNFQGVLLALVTAILGFGVLLFAGRSVAIIGESTFYKLFMKLLNQIPLLSNLIETVLKTADTLRK